jgi:hypothetical protein
MKENTFFFYMKHIGFVINVVSFKNMKVSQVYDICFLCFGADMNLHKDGTIKKILI